LTCAKKSRKSQTCVRKESKFFNFFLNVLKDLLRKFYVTFWVYCCKKNENLWFWLIKSATPVRKVHLSSITFKQTLQHHKNNKFVLARSTFKIYTKETDVNERKSIHLMKEFSQFKSFIASNNSFTVCKSNESISL
jgi:hypothetical protein